MGMEIKLLNIMGMGLEWEWRGWEWECLLNMGIPLTLTYTYDFAFFICSSIMQASECLAQLVDYWKNAALHCHLT